jgi:Rod binding domain-containing protein
MSSSIQAAPSGNQVNGLQRLTSKQASRRDESTLDSPRAKKLRKATQEFESILVTSWWEEMEKSFGGTEQHEPGFEAFHDMGLRAMTLAMAKAGGFGIARTLFHQLQPALGRAESQAQP